MHETGSSVSNSSRSSIWPHYPPVTITVKERLHKQVGEEHVVQVGSDEFVVKRRNREYVLSLLFVLRHVTSLRLVFTGEGYASLRRAGKFHVPSALLNSLRHFSHLRFLEVQSIRPATERSLQAALDLLPSLTRWEVLFSYHGTDGRAGWTLARVLFRLCTRHVMYLTVSNCMVRMLDQLVQYDHAPAMPQIHSLTVTAAPHWPYTVQLGRVIIRCFPSLLHLTVSSNEVIRDFAAEPLPPLSSLTLYGATQADMSDINTRTFCLFEPEGGYWNDRREEVRVMLTHAPRTQQLALSVNDTLRVKWRLMSDNGCHIFPSGSTLSSPFSGLVYLEFLDGLALADLTYLLDATSPPVFADQLTHLALSVQRKDRAAAAALLPPLSSIYPSLTHAHVGVEGVRIGEQLTEWAQWDTAVRAVRAAVGSAWCDRASAVVACRDDVAWRRSTGLPNVRILY